MFKEVMSNATSGPKEHTLQKLSGAPKDFGLWWYRLWFHLEQKRFKLIDHKEFVTTTSTNGEDKIHVALITLLHAEVITILLDKAARSFQFRDNLDNLRFKLLHTLCITFRPTLGKISIIWAILSFYAATRETKESISAYADCYRFKWATLLAHDEVLPEGYVVAAFINSLSPKFKMLHDMSTLGLRES